MGFGAVKLRVKDPERRRDAEILRQAREHLGRDFVIAVDANQGWPVSIVQPHPDWDLAYATEFAQACDELDIAWLEEPLDMHDWDGMAELRRRVRTPIAGGEIHGAWHEFRPLFEHECLARYQPDAMFSGLTVAGRVMAECRRRGLAYSPHTWSNGFNVLVNLHAFAAWEERDWLEYPFEPPGFLPEYRDGMVPTFRVKPDGTIDVPQGPGLGVTIDERALRRWGSCFHVSTPLRVAVRAIREKGLGAALTIARNRKAAGANTGAPT
jgi:L-alanine-DL-glutamate epimerase-like enolase superfamily enzyme